MEIKVKYLANIEPIEPIEQKENCDWIDLRASQDIYLEEGEFAYIPLGVCIKLPEGYEAHLAPRSSSFKNWGIIQTNSVGVIDESYCGDNDQWCMPVYATRTTMIFKNERICQFRIMKKMGKLDIHEVGALHEKDRCGFGSTGTY